MLKNGELMDCFNIPRQNGKTTRLIANITTAIVSGKQVLVIFDNMFLAKTVLDSFKTMVASITTQSSSAHFGDLVWCTNIDNLHSYCPNASCDCIASDPGRLTDAEWDAVKTYLKPNFEVLDELNQASMNQQIGCGNTTTRKIGIISSR